MTRLALLSALLTPVLALAQVPSIDQSLSMKSVQSAQISPDGRFIAYTVQETNWEDNAFVQQVWIAMPSTGECYQLTQGRKSNASPRWAPDSRHLAFISERDGKKQIYRIAPSGGEAVQLTNEENGVGSFEWSPDGSTIAFTSSGPESKLLKDRKERYGELQVVDGDYVMMHLWLLSVPADVPADPKRRPQPQALTQGNEFSVENFNWAPDGKRIAFEAQRDPDLSSSATANIYVVNVGDKLVKKLAEGKGPNHSPIWSPDGTQIAYTTSNGNQYSFYTNVQVALISPDGGTPRLIAKDFDENPRLIRWTNSGLYFGAFQKTANALFKLDPASGNFERINSDEVYISGPSLTSDGRTLAGLVTRPNAFPEVFVSPVAGFAPRTLTNFSAQWKDFRLAKREVVSWKSTDGTTIEGILIKPAGFDPARKYPLLVVIHGGPTGIDTPVMSADRTYPVEMFAAKGALILKPNYRGSAGYGEKFRSLNVRNLGLGDYADVISGVDSLIAKGIVDKDRVGSMGWSQGGYISAFITCYSDRFKAVSVGAGISDWSTYYVNTDIHPFTRQYLKATPWEDPEIYQKTSPIYYVNRAKTPTLIQHGDQDKRVPPPNAFELHQALKDRGIPVKLILFKGFGHGIDKPKQQRALMEQNYEFFSKYIWGEEAPGRAESATAAR